MNLISPLVPTHSDAHKVHASNVLERTTGSFHATAAAPSLMPCETCERAGIRTDALHYRRLEQLLETRFNQLRQRLLQTGMPTGPTAVDVLTRSHPTSTAENAGLADASATAVLSFEAVTDPSLPWPARLQAVLRER
jgi:hypothetical protein